MTRPGRRCCRYRLDPDALRYAMARAGMDPGTLALRSGVPRRTVGAYLTGRATNPGGSYLVQMAEVLGVDPVDLMEPWETGGGDG